MSDIVEKLRGMAGVETSALYSQRKTLNEAADIIAEMRSVLEFFLCIDFDRFTEHDELLLEDTIRDARALTAPPSKS